MVTVLPTGSTVSNACVKAFWNAGVLALTPSTTWFAATVTVAVRVGRVVGCRVGWPDGADGRDVGCREGWRVGCVVGCSVGCSVGWDEGSCVGCSVGCSVG